MCTRRRLLSLYTQFRCSLHVEWILELGNTSSVGVLIVEITHKNTNTHCMGVRKYKRKRARGGLAESENSHQCQYRIYAMWIVCGRRCFFFFTFLFYLVLCRQFVYMIRSHMGIFTVYIWGSWMFVRSAALFSLFLASSLFFSIRLFLSLANVSNRFSWCKSFLSRKIFLSIIMLRGRFVVGKMYVWVCVCLLYLIWFIQWARVFLMMNIVTLAKHTISSELSWLKMWTKASERKTAWENEI